MKSLLLMFFVFVPVFAQASFTELQIEKDPSAAGYIGAVRVHSAEERSFISGSLRRFQMSGLAAGAHVHVSLWDQFGKLVADDRDELPRQAPKFQKARGYRLPFATGFSTAAMNQTAKVRVSFHNHSHTRCDND